MKTKFQLLVASMLALCALALLTPPAQAADYGIQKTLWGATTWTNTPASATNLDAAVDLTQFTEFTLEVQLGLTNAATGTYDLRWTTSNDGSAYTSHPALGDNSGWFSVPITNNGTATYWRTNISVGARGYWKISWGTNQTGANITNAVIRAYVKPKNSSWR